MTQGLNDKEKKILRLLFKHRVALPINFIAKGSKLSWSTTQKYVNELENDGYVIKGKNLGRDAWKINMKKYKKLKMKK